MNRLLITTLSLALVALIGCSKALIESSAPGVIQKFVDSQNGGIVRTFAGALTNQLGTEMPNAWWAPGVQRLLQQGYIEQKTASVSYPNFSGQYNGSHEISLGGNTKVDTLDSQTISNERPPHVEGSFKTCFQNVCDVGPVSGVVQRSGLSSTLTVVFRGFFNESFTVTFLRGQTDAIVGTYQGTGIPATPFRAIHVGPNPPDIQQDIYTYTWTKKLPTDIISGAMLTLGSLAVDSCEHLLLTSETTATASCRTHVKLTETAQAIFGSRPTDESMQASFGKQPDGTWIGTAITYSAPQYNVLQ